MIKELHALRTFLASSLDEVQVHIDSYISQKVRSGSNCVAVVGYNKHEYHFLFLDFHLGVSGCKENHFYSLPFGQAEASIY